MQTEVSNLNRGEARHVHTQAPGEEDPREPLLVSLLVAGSQLPLELDSVPLSLYYLFNKYA